MKTTHRLPLNRFATRWLCQRSVLSALVCFVPYSHADLLTNRQFESGDYSGWTTVGTGWSIGQGVSNSDDANGAIFQSDISNWGSEILLYQDVPVTQGAYYSAHMFVLADNISSSECWLEIEWKRNDGSTIYSQRTTSINSNQDYQPSQQALSLVAPNEAVTVRVAAVVDRSFSSPSDTDTYGFDQFSFEQNPQGLLANPDFAVDDLEGWSTIGTQWSRSYLWEEYNHVARYTHMAEETNVYPAIYQCFPVSPGSMYVAYGVIYSDNPWTSEAWVEIHWLDTNGIVIAHDEGEHVSPVDAHMFSRLYSLISPTNAIAACVRGVIDVSSLSYASGTTYMFKGFRVMPIVPISAFTVTADAISVGWDGSGPRGILQQTINLTDSSWENTHLIPDLVSNRWVVSSGSILNAKALRYRMVLP